MAKSNATISVEINQSIGEMVYRVAGAGEVTFHVARAHPENRAYAEYHGWKQRHVDKAALGFDKETGRYATPVEKLAAIRASVEYYETGVQGWTRGGAPGARRVTDAALLAGIWDEAFPARPLNAERRAWLDGLTRQQVGAFLELPNVKAIADRVRALGAAGVDTDALLAGMPQ